MSRTLFHSTTTAAAANILTGGFRDGAGSYGFASTEIYGVFLAGSPSTISDGAEGDQVLAVELPADLDLDQFAIVEVGHPTWEWCVPAQLLNARSRVRLLSQEEVDRG